MTLHRCPSLLYGERDGRSDRQESRRRETGREREERRPMVRHTGVKRAIKRDATARSPNLGCRSSSRDCSIERAPCRDDCRTSASIPYLTRFRIGPRRGSGVSSRAYIHRGVLRDFENSRLVEKILFPRPLTVFGISFLSLGFDPFPFLSGRLFRTSESFIALVSSGSRNDEADEAHGFIGSRDKREVINCKLVQDRARFRIIRERVLESQSGQP